MKCDSSNKAPIHGVKFVDGQPTVVFDTVCTKHKSKWLADEDVHSKLVKVWIEADAWLVGRYVIMPDHIHFFAWATDAEINYENWVRFWKSQFTRQHGAPECQWQPDHWDTRMRCESHYEEKWNYVRQNPVRAKLAKNTDGWPYQGEVFELGWEK